MKPCLSRPPVAWMPALIAALFSAQSPAALGEDAAQSADHRPKQVYMNACASCHGADGTGQPHSRVGFDIPLPDFTDCSFATREPNADWVAVAHQGGPIRAFSQMMPAFGAALSQAELEAAVRHIRTFCSNDAWPRGEFNLPRALVTTKAYPEDEIVLESTIATDEPGSVVNQLVFEKRFGARNQFEIAVPFGWKEQLRANGNGEDWEGGVGDVVAGLKRVVYADLDRGTILSLSGELSLPTGDTDAGFGSDTAIFEPSLLYGQILADGWFLQAQGGFGIPFDDDKANDEAYARLAAGRSITQGRFGRVWSPMVEVLADRELVSGAETEWSVLPQMQLTLSKRQHVRLNAGLRIPLNNRDQRETQVLVYLLWDWFDGGLLEGW